MGQLQVSAHTWVVSQSARPAISAAGSALATVPTTTSPDASGRVPLLSTSRFPNTTSPRTPAWLLVKLVDNAKRRDQNWSWVC